MQHTLLITGAAGYVGAMLVERFAAREDVERIIGLDKEPLPEMLKGQKKLHYIQSNTADDWEAEAQRFAPDIVIHTAWQIRELYGDRATTWKWNIDGSDRVFSFAFKHEFVKRLVHFSTVASYGAFADNSMEYRYTEQDPFRKSEYLYAEEKRITEEHLWELYGKRSNKDVAVTLLRPAAITGPRGRFMRIRFGLQSALSGSLKEDKSPAYRIVSMLVSRIPAPPKWLRQFIHEDDVVGIVERVAFGAQVPGYEIFNICPPGPVVLAEDMARVVGKKLLPIAPWMMRIANFFAWNLSQGKIPTGPGAWRSYSYPIAVDGSKVTKILGYQYQHESLDAFQYTTGTYETYVPEAQRKAKT